MRKAKVYFSTDSPKELAEGVRQVGERLVYDIEMPGGRPPQMPGDRTARRDRQTLRAAIMQAIGTRGEASREELKESLGDVSEEELDRTIALMLASGIMYEVSPGRYKVA